jgi:hypothetical protein
MAHRHLILAYSATFLIQLCYVAYVGLKYRALRRLEKEFPAYSPKTE